MTAATPITSSMAPAWARLLSADEYDEPDEDGGDLELERRPRRGRRRHRAPRT